MTQECKSARRRNYGLEEKGKLKRNKHGTEDMMACEVMAARIILDLGALKGKKIIKRASVCVRVYVCVCVRARRKCTAGTDDTPSWKSPRVPGVTCGFSAGWAGAVAGSGRGRVPSGDGASHGRRAL